VYDSAKDGLIASGYFVDGIPCHFTAAVIAGFCATLLASPVDVIKTRYSWNFFIYNWWFFQDFFFKSVFCVSFIEKLLFVG
jgi:hypothetical protein